MPVNNPTPAPAVRRPRPRVMVGNTPLPGCVGVSVTSTNNYTGDTFHADFAPLVGLAGTGSLAWWASQDSIRVDVQIGLVPDRGAESQAVWQSMLIGVVDQVSVDPIAGTASIDGRDLTALMRDSGKGGFDVNQTSSQIVTQIAQMNGLTPVVTATTTIVGRYYEVDHGRTGLSTAHHVANQWDAVVELARLEGFDAFVQGTELHFQPPADESSDPWVLSASGATAGAPANANVLSLLASRALHIARGVKVVVKSWHSKQAKAIASTQSTDGVDPQTYTLIRPGLTQDQADNLAKRTLAEITKHERTISASAPGDLLLTPRLIVRLEGTGTGFDQTYYPTQINRRLGNGFTMDFTAKNQSPQVLASAGAG